MYIDYKQNNQLEWLATVEFVFNKKVITIQDQLQQKAKNRL